MDNEESIKRTKLAQMTMLLDALATCNEPDSKGHALFLYTNDDAKHMTILSFNAGADDVYSMVQHMNDLITKSITAAMQDAPPREKYN